MGQTLTHGVYLPDEGERNCYSGLAANWQLLDGAVGTIAEHTTQIAGKANAVHTHTKSDVTDLFNSANEWTQINTYTVALRFSAANYSAGTPSSDIFYGSLQWGGIVNNTFVQSFGINNAIRTTGINDISLRVWSQTGSTLRGVAVETNADASNSSLRPLVNNVTNLGSTIYQWNDLYAKKVNTRSVNGINPGALGLPVTALNNTYDISGDITDLTGGNNSITAARTGWIFVKSDNATEISIENTTTGMGASDHSAVAATLMVSIPVTSGETLNIIANCTSIDKAYLLPCQGNV